MTCSIYVIEETNTVSALLYGIANKKLKTNPAYRYFRSSGRTLSRCASTRP